VLRTFIQVTSLVLTLEAAFFLARGNLGLSAENIAELGKMKLDYNADVIWSLSEQRADTWIGVVLLLMAFSLQMANTLWQVRWVDFAVSKRGAVLGVIVSAVIGVGAYALSPDLAKRTEARVKQILEVPAPTAPKPSGQPLK